MRLDILNGNVITGDGNEMLENRSVVIEDGFITDLPKVNYIPYNTYADGFIDAKGDYVIPGLINIHTHGTSFGPFMPYVWKRIPYERFIFNLNTFLLEGVTTILDADGITLPEEVQAANKCHPINLRIGTFHTPKNLATVDIIDCAGESMDDLHRNFTIDEAVAQGAVAIAEVGSPGTTAGTFEKCTRLKKVISANQARALDHAVLRGDRNEIRQVLDEASLQDVSIEEGIKLAEVTSINPIKACCEAITESAVHAKKYNLPVLAHSEPGMKDTIINLAREIGSLCIAVHVNHSFKPEDAVAYVKELKSYGAFAEIITSDSYHAKQIDPTPAASLALLKEGLIDLISTDYSGGYHDPILLVMQKAVEKGYTTLPEAIAMATGNAAKAIPKLARNRGIIKEGYIGDICIIDKNDISKVKHVVIFGRVVVNNGRLVPMYPPYYDYPYPQGHVF